MVNDLAVALIVLSIFGVIYPYLIYPLVLVTIRTVRGRRSLAEIKSGVAPSNVTFIISVYNGEHHIGSKLSNLVHLRGFDETCRVIVVSDSSADSTDEIVQSFPHPSVRLLRATERRGKAEAENLALRHTDSDIIVFTDAATLLDVGALEAMLTHFGDARVGCVSTEDRIMTENTGSQTSEEGIYVKYEMLLRHLESGLGVLAGASGSAYACRRSIALELPSHLTRDFHVPLEARKRGLLTLSEPRALCAISTQRSLGAEYARKVRTFTGGIDTLMYMKDLLNPFRYGLFSVALISHKLIRWLGPLFLACVFLLTGLRAPSSVDMAVLFISQVGVYGYCVLRAYARWGSGGRFADLLYFFVITNCAAVVAWYNHFRGRRFAVWQPTIRI